MRAADADRIRQRAEANDAGPSLEIASITTTLVDLPLIRPHRFSALTIESQSFVIVRLLTKEGVEGIGEAVVPGGPWWGGDSIEGVKALIDTYISPLLVGEDAARIGAVRAKLDRMIKGGRSAKAGVEMALWDACGKALGVPLHRLLGGICRDRLPVTWAIGADPAAAAMAEIERKVQSGSHHSFKLKMGGSPPEQDVARIVEVARSCPPSVSLRVDLNGSWDEATATRLLPLLAEAGIELVEQPVPGWNLEAMGRLAARIAVPLMADESVCTAQDAMRVAHLGAAGCLSLKLAKCGGILPVQQIAGIAEAAGIGCHGGTTIESSIGTAASAHVFCATPGVSAGSELFGPLLLAEDLVMSPVDYVDGELRPPSGPGLGVEIDWTKIRRFTR